MAWIECHQSLRMHPKTLAASAALAMNRHEFIGHLMCLWWWALDVADVDGRLPKQCTFDVLAEAAELPRHKGQAFVEALLSAGFLDHDEETGGWVLHDWYDYAGKLNARRAANKQRQLLHREALRNAHVTRTSQSTDTDSDAHVTRTSQPEDTDQEALRNAHVTRDVTHTSRARHIATNQTNQTNQDQTNPDQGKHHPPPNPPPTAEEVLQQRPNIFRLYEHLFGKGVSPLIAERLKEYEQTHSDECVRHCFQEAAESNARSVRFVYAILDRHKAEGCYVDRGRKGRGEPAAGADTAGVAAGVLGLDRRRALIAERRRQSEQAREGLRGMGAGPPAGVQPAAAE
jgi:hypothetical protein